MRTSLYALGPVAGAKCPLCTNRALFWSLWPRLVKLSISESESDSASRLLVSYVPARRKTGVFIGFSPYAFLLKAFFMPAIVSANRICCVAMLDGLSDFREFDRPRVKTPRRLAPDP